MTASVLRTGSRRDDLVLAAFELIARKGMEGLRLREVAQAVGLDHSTLHHYFPTKEDLIGEVVSYATGQLAETLRLDGTPVEQVTRHLRLTGRAVRDRTELFVVLCELNLRANRDPAIRAIIDRSDQNWRGPVEAQLARMSWAPGFDPATIASLIIAAVKGTILDPGTAPDVLDQLERLLVQAQAR
ncbi:TetR/AcrR family transcriptional regulator [Pseudonocardia spinosispora]|uniref:TetR/AcrR family transcriptional regulator n=1 Tax=Pseudonocardia spinosispora TaxID=103441 RepID=UPI00041D7840|nr:TetR/AcrR family transcriptional regulator [Pseudonocardia spinosispora]